MFRVVFSPPRFKVKETQIHCLCDASSTSYGAVAYLRLEYHKGGIHFAFVVNKSRVAPLRAMTIAQLKLVAVVVGVKLVQFLKRELDLEIDETYFWTDSTSVFQYVRSTSARFQVCVANRIAAIHAGSDPSQWHYVDTKTNVAEMASRGFVPDQIKKAETWFKGPEFLHRPKNE